MLHRRTSHKQVWRWIIKVNQLISISIRICWNSTALIHFKSINVFNNAHLRRVYKPTRPAECMPLCCCSAHMPHDAVPPPELAPRHRVYQWSSSPLMTQQPLCTLTSLPLWLSLSLHSHPSLPASTRTLNSCSFVSSLFSSISIILLPFSVSPSLHLLVPHTATSFNSFYPFYPFPVPGI